MQTTIFVYFVLSRKLPQGKCLASCAYVHFFYLPQRSERHPVKNCIKELIDIVQICFMKEDERLVLLNCCITYELIIMLLFLVPLI